MPDKITILIPAYNEESIILKLISPLRMWKQNDWHNRSIIIVDDGSKDQTMPAAKSQWTEVIKSDELGRNLGKADAFIKGVRYASKNCAPDFIVTLDADLIDLNPKHIDELVAELKHTGSNMVIAKSLEFSEHYGWVNAAKTSGQRAFRVAALNPIILGNKKWLTILEGSKYGLEEALNVLIPKHRSSEITFHADTALRKSFATTQGDQRRLIRERISERRVAAKALRALRKGKQGHRVL
ncbi:Undecaprenyl-phosphate 4-deoxy-4-formamido-L-arabinose transferase [uncultured archaeon]|nr:Undecaprenyl-phosphate 4-deoxy-4-formamido-L-arabinose transferase [uncultured archaeon]